MATDISELMERREASEKRMEERNSGKAESGSKKSSDAPLTGSNTGAANAQSNSDKASSGKGGIVTDAVIAVVFALVATGLLIYYF